MTWTIVRKEILANLLSYKFYVVILLAAVLVATSFFIMTRDYKERLADYSLIRPKPGEPIAVNPPNPLSIFAKGLDEAMARSFEVGPTGISVRAGQKSGNTVFAFFPTPDFLYIVRVVLSLVALLFGFDQVSREKEAGTLRQMLANQTSRSAILIGKWAGNFLSLAVPFLLVTTLGIAVLGLDPDIRFSSDQVLRLGLILALTLVYIAFFLSLGILVSALTRRASSSLVILLFVWALLVFVLPNLGTLVARQMVDVPSVRALSEKRQQVWTREVLLRIRGVGDWASHIKTISAENDALEADYRVKFDRLVNLSKNINRISPVASFVYAATEIAGTGIGEEGAYKSEVGRYKNAVLGKRLASPDLKSSDYPAFLYRYRPLGRVLVRGALFDTAWLAVCGILFFALSYFVFVRYDVR
ncbi:MAG: ABC transporter permease subunit [Candidatus Aminicenantes bacterium]|nr:ABC transporter permease subunit [Candidatus Aminicenantes bacterium]